MKDGGARYLVEGKYGIRDLVDLTKLRRVFERFSEATGFTIGFVEHPSREILIATGWRDICTKFHRAHPGSLDSCAKSNASLTERTKQAGQLVVEECGNGLTDCGTPIILRGAHVATLATGQMLLVEPDPERFKEQAERYGYDKEEYFKALSGVRVVSEDELRRMGAFLSELATLIIDLGLQGLEARERYSLVEEEAASRRGAEEALKESEIRFRTIFDSVNDAILIHDPLTGSILDVNKRMCEMYGYTREEARRLRVGEISEGAPPYSEAEALEWLRRAGSIGPQVVRWRAKRRSGELFWVEVSIRRAAIGGEERLFVTIRDITDRVEAEEMLRRTEAKYHAIFDDAIMGIFQTSPDGRLLSANRALARLHGFDSPEALMGAITSIGDQLYVRKEDRHRLMGLYRAKGYVEGFEVELLRKDGTVILISMNARAVKDEQGRILFYEGTAEDVTERRRAEEALRESEQLHRFLTENVTDMISRHGENGMVLYVTPSSEAVLGYGPEELVGKLPAICMPPEDERKAWDMIHAAMQCGKDYYRLEHRMIRKGGREIWVETAGRLILDGRNSLKEVHCAVRDITARKQLEA